MDGKGSDGIVPPKQAQIGKGEIGGRKGSSGLKLRDPGPIMKKGADPVGDGLIAWRTSGTNATTPNIPQQ